MRKGFTLIELLVVIAIIAILAAILFPVFAKAREKARTAACQSNLKQYAVAVKIYFDDYDGYGPFTSCGNFIPKRLKGRCPVNNTSQNCGMYACPNGPYSFPYYRGGNCAAGPTSLTTPWSEESHPYGYRVKNPSEVLLVADARAGHMWQNDPGWFYDLEGNGLMSPRHGSINNVAFLDGHVKGLSPSWLRLDLEQGDADSNSDGRADGDLTGQGAWYRWWR